MPSEGTSPEKERAPTLKELADVVAGHERRLAYVESEGVESFLGHGRVQREGSRRGWLDWIKEHGWTLAYVLLTIVQFGLFFVSRDWLMLLGAAACAIMAWLTYDTTVS